LPRLLLVTDRRRAVRQDLAAALRGAAAGGVRFVQVREPDLDDRGLREVLRAAADVGGGAIELVVNGRPGLACELGVGVHLPAAAPGEPAAAARRRGAIPRLGRSVHSAPAARRAVEREPLDYLVFGHVWETASKPGLPARGIDELARVVDAVAPVPVLAIGGITPERVAAVLGAGAWGVAVCGGILAAPDPRAAAAAFLRGLGAAR
jgi:thiamine-phosphate pyrophosphorylase